MENPCHMLICITQIIKLSRKGSTVGHHYNAENTCFFHIFKDSITAICIITSVCDQLSLISSLDQFCMCSTLWSAVCRISSTCDLVFVINSIYDQLYMISSAWSGLCVIGCMWDQLCDQVHVGTALSVIVSQLNILLVCCCLCLIPSAFPGKQIKDTAAGRLTQGILLFSHLCSVCVN